MTLFAIEISDAVWLAIIGVVAMAVKEYFDRSRANLAAGKVAEVATQAKGAAAKVEQVATDLKITANEHAEKLDEMAAVGQATHTLVNSNMAKQMQISAKALRTIAHLTPSDPEAAAAADLAEKLLRDHESKQAVVDAAESPISSDAKAVVGAIENLKKV